MGDDDFRLLFEANPRPMWVVDRETLAFMLVNEAACETYGYAREEFLAMTLRQLRPDCELERFDRTIAESDGAPKPSLRGARHATKDGRVIDVDLDIARITFRDRAASLVVVKDITGVDEAARLFRVLVEHSADGASIIDEAGVIRYMNPAAERLLGFTPGQLIGKHARSEAHPDDKPALAAPAAGEVRTYVTRVKHGNGSWRWIEATTTNLTHDISVRAHVSSFREVTDRVEAEQLLRRSEANFRSLIERTPTLLFVHRDGIIRYANPAAIAQLGYDTADELVGQTVIDLVHPDDRASVRTRIEKTIREGGGAPGVARMKRRDGTYIATEGEGLLLDFDGEPSNVVLGRDVTERNEMFARMAVADRLVSVGTLAAGVAHELNNPISYVMSNLAVLEDELPALVSGESRLSRAAVATLIADAREGIARVGAIVRDLRALSRDDETTGPVDVASVLASSIKMTANEVRQRARIVTSIGERLPAVQANATRLGQVFLNLLVNAAHAIEEGRPRENEIRVRARAQGDTVVIEIEDTGAGMPRNVLARIFDPFFTTKPVGVGTGLGLSISHEIVRSFGGSISVESTPGRGSTFRIALPTTSAHATDAAVTETSSVASARVLMIDDEISMGRSTRILMAREYDITPVTRAQDGLARIANGEHYDAIVCDLMMPEMSGVEFYAKLETDAPEYARRVVFVSAGAFTEQARTFLSKTAQPHVEKPFAEAALRAAIERVRQEHAR